MKITTLLTKSKSEPAESVDDLPCSKDNLEMHQSGSKLENALEISQVRFFFQPKDSDDWDEHCHPEVPSNEDMVKLINLNEDQGTLQITLQLDDIEKKLNLGTSHKEFCKNIHLYRNLLPNEYKGTKSEILVHQECGEEDIVETRSCILQNSNFFNIKPPETKDKVDTLKCEANTLTNWTEKKHGDTYAAEFTTSSTNEPKCSLSKSFTDSSVQCDKLQEDFPQLKDFLLKESGTSCSFSSITKENESNISVIDSRSIIHAHTQTEISSDSTHSFHNKTLDKSNILEGSVNGDIHNNILNQPGLVNSSISFLQTLISECVKASIKTGLPFIGEINAPKIFTSNTSQTDLKTTKDSLCQTYTAPDLSINDSHSLNKRSEVNEFCSDQIESIPTMEIASKISKSLMNDFPKLPTINYILPKTQEMGCNISNPTNKDFFYLKDLETHSNFNLNENDMEINSLNSGQIANEKVNFLLPQSITSNQRNEIAAWMTDENRLSFDSNAKIQCQFFNADCLPSDSKAEKSLPVLPKTSNPVPESIVKLFDFEQNGQFEPIIENPCSVELVEPTRVHQNPCSSVDCNKVNEVCKEDLLNSRSTISTLSIGSYDFRLICTEEPRSNSMTVLFCRKSQQLLETNGHFVICLCDDCYNKTQQTVDDNIINHGSIRPKMDEVEYKPFRIESSSPSSAETAIESETVVSKTASLKYPCSIRPKMDKVECKPLHIETNSPTYEETPIESKTVVHETASVKYQCSIRPALDKVEFKTLRIQSNSTTDEETPIDSETGVSEKTSVKSVIESLYPMCEALNDHLLGLKKVDEDLLTKSKDSLTTKWLKVATDRYSRPKEVYNYLQYFQEFSDTLAKFILHSTDPEGNNALHFSYGNNRFDMAEEILNNKHGPALLRKRNKLGHTPLMICAVAQPETQEDWSTVKKSVEMGNVNEASPSSGQTALMNAASRGLEDMVRTLLSAGADPNQLDRDGSTALMYATEQGREACVALMLEHPGCDPFIKDQDGQTASSIAIGAGHKDIALRIYLHRKKIPSNAMQQATKAYKKEKFSI
ncbi:hypothetical protein JTE90_021343 [Oedothorax gibbosus]|uniref:KN motif and ankyrin repeat domain-containing protein 1 n=1 Tax=Oedothorax gibbosus TaxID=931172 RepID=A0AAV6TX00_9ARAC|nr:hypothetical protein JTE90_021343 [Oedothorax gibbosus]